MISGFPILFGLAWLDPECAMNLDSRHCVSHANDSTQGTQFFVFQKNKPFHIGKQHRI